jgi:TonB family protein
MKALVSKTFLTGIALLLATAGCGGKDVSPTYDVPPVLANREEITAAMSAVGAGLETRVVLQVRVDERGYVREAQVAKSSGIEDLDAAALWIGEQMRFEPAQHEGKAVSAWVQVPVTFDIVKYAVRPPRLQNAEEVVAVIARDYTDLRGTARFRVHVGSQGWARQVRDSRPYDREVMIPGRELLDDRIKFWPANREGRPVNQWVTLVIEFAAERSRIYIDEPDA